MLCTEIVVDDQQATICGLIADKNADNYIVSCGVSSNDVEVDNRDTLSIESASRRDQSCVWVHCEVRAAVFAGRLDDIIDQGFSSIRIGS